MARTLQEQLDSVDLAIMKSEDQREYSIKGRTMIRQDIESLYAERTRLISALSRQTSRASSGGLRTVEFGG